MKKAMGTYSPTQPLYSSDEWTYLEAKRYNAHTREPINGYDCPICFNKQSIMVTQESRGQLYNGIKPCECQSIHNTQLNINRSNMAKVLETMTMEAFNTKDEVTKHMKSLALDYVENYNGETWFYIGGQVGAGKTHIATATINELMKKGNQALYMRWHEITQELKPLVNDKEYANIMRKYQTANLLYIDDFLKKYTDADLDIAFRLLQGRLDNNLATIITSEKFAMEIPDEAIRSRIEQACKKYNVNIGRDTKKNQRLKI